MNGTEFVHVNMPMILVLSYFYLSPLYVAAGLLGMRRRRSKPEAKPRYWLRVLYLSPLILFLVVFFGSFSLSFWLRRHGWSDAVEYGAFYSVAAGPAAAIISAAVEFITGKWGRSAKSGATHA